MPFSQLFERYDTTFVVLLGLLYFNQGLKVLSSLANSTLFKEHYKLDPGQVQILSSVISFPWSIKIVYGLISDNLPIFGSRRRSYLVIFSIS